MNVSNNAGSSSTVLYSDIVVYIVYFVQGILLIIFNGVLLLVIAKYEALHSCKEFIIVGALALADTIFGCFMISAGKIRKLKKMLLCSKNGGLEKVF